MENKKKIIIGLLILLVLALIALWISGKRLNKTASNNNNAPATKRSVVDGFPKDLILDSQAVILSSSNVPSNDSAKLYTTKYLSYKLPGTLINEYEAYLKSNGYTVTSKTVADPISSIYGRKSNSDINVGISSTEHAPMTSVSVSYSTK